MGDAPLDLRPLDLAADLDLAVTLARESEQQSMGWIDLTPGHVVSLLTGPDAVPTEGRIAEADGKPVGLLNIEIDRELNEVFIDAFATGEPLVDRLRALVGAGLEAASRLAHGDPQWRVGAGCHPEQVAYSTVLGESGFVPVRRFWRMALELSPSRPVPTPPEGVKSRVVRDDADVRTVWEIDAAAFADHYGAHTEESFDAWLADIEARPGHRLDRWWIAERDGVPVGICLLDDSRLELGEDHVRHLGVLPQARGHGIARWLLEQAAYEAAQQGLSALTLSVDGENTTGATRLYESVGFITRHVVDKWERPLVTR